MTEPLDRSRENALSAIRKAASDQSVDLKIVDAFLERFIDIGYKNQFNDTDRTVARSELKVLLDQVTPLFESNKDED
jgi:phenylalanyl-tRNA synthetase beta subunit